MSRSGKLLRTTTRDWMNFSKNISFADNSVTMTTKKWRHGFWKKAFFSVSRLTCWYLRLQSLKKFYWSVSDKNSFEYFATKNLKFVDISSFLTHVSRVLAIFRCSLIEHFSLKVSSCLLQLISHYEVKSYALNKPTLLIK